LAADAADLVVNLSGARKWLRVEARIAGYSTPGVARLRFNGDTGSNYSYARTDDAGALNTGTSQDGIRVARTVTAGPRYFTVNIRNVAAQSKVVILEGTSGESALEAPVINHVRGVWGNTAGQITSLTVNSGSAGNLLLSGSEVSVWGTN
jgi:hypothetical protein